MKVIPLLFKEGAGVVALISATTPNPSSPEEEGSNFQAGRKSRRFDLTLGV